MAVVAELEEIWSEGSGLATFIGTVDHKRIGLRYLYTGFVFFVIAGLEASLMRVQLARPDLHVVTPQTYDELFSMHGVTMMFLFATPVLSGFGNYFVPLMIGARDMAFPRLNAFGYWVFLGAGIFFTSAFVAGQAPNDGWFDYVPLASSSFSPNHAIDFYALGLIFIGVSTTVGAINFIVTAFKCRAPGMSLTVTARSPALITEIDVPVRSRLCSVRVALTTTVSRLSPGAGSAARTAPGISDVLKRINRKL